ncbi:hypothetical protein HIM_05331 [Hirsutella minnesotensis 3608]|uniref:Transmembrane protein n=1 Tax=Hirsutella minnesotensis 3608 TaxID=1043627 RepID=A0A0F7ZPF4_9HYPO|nr:hypothetical protein HIM_05331 [Hirsutella minnesotensis 3608]
MLRHGLPSQRLQRHLITFGPERATAAFFEAPPCRSRCRTYSSRDSSHSQSLTSSHRKLPKADETATSGPQRVTLASRASRESESSTRQSKDRDALRSAEARETVLRAARTRRLAEKQESEREAAMAQLERENYERRYKAASRRWLSTMVALPFLIVTTYYLYGRLFLGHDQKKIKREAAPANEDQ